MNKRDKFIEIVINDFLSRRVEYEVAGWMYMPTENVVRIKGVESDSIYPDTHEQHIFSFKNLENWSLYYPFFCNLFEVDYGITDKSLCVEIVKKLVVIFQDEIIKLDKAMGLDTLNESMDKKEKIRFYFKDKIYNQTYGIWLDHFRDSMTYEEALQSDIDELIDMSQTIGADNTYWRDELHSNYVMKEMINDWGMDPEETFKLYISILYDLMDEEEDVLDESRKIIKKVLKEDIENKKERFINYLRSVYLPSVMPDRNTDYTDCRQQVGEIYDELTEKYGLSKDEALELAGEWFYERCYFGVLPKLGDLIEITFLAGDEPNIGAGDQGFVTDITRGWKNELQIHIDWTTTKSSLPILYDPHGAADEWEVVKGVSNHMLPKDFIRYATKSI
jgi:hypothetical protein